MRRSTEVVFAESVFVQNQFDTIRKSVMERLCGRRCVVNSVSWERSMGYLRIEVFVKLGGRPSRLGRVRTR